MAKKLIRKITTVLAFVGIIGINIIAGDLLRRGFQLTEIAPTVLLIAGVMVLNLLVAIFTKTLTHFVAGITGITILGVSAIYLYPPLAMLFLYNAIAALYVGLFLAALLPILLGRAPFSESFSKPRYPKAVGTSPIFRKPSVLISWMWVGVFGVSIVLSILKYTDNYMLQQLLQNIIPIALQLGVGLPLTKYLEKKLPQTLITPQIHFESNKDLFEAMPFSMNKKKAEGIDTVLQFHLSGDEVINGYLTIKDQGCTFTEGEHDKPSTTITVDSKLWLDISNGDVDGGVAYVEKRYSVEGDVSILLDFADLFTNAPSED